mmetsp:Transcript_18359/g.43630  ORF Transcript_18359/g.43630 Transcript_18359/m.43630 type:complete len:100 (+) Transcript_18359:661-960(+)
MNWRQLCAAHAASTSAGGRDEDRQPAGRSSSTGGECDGAKMDTAAAAVRARRGTLQCENATGVLKAPLDMAAPDTSTATPAAFIAAPGVPGAMRGRLRT